MVGQPFNILQKKYDILPKKLKLFLKIPFLHYFPSNHTHFEPYSWKKTFNVVFASGMTGDSWLGRFLISDKRRTTSHTKPTTLFFCLLQVTAKAPISHSHICRLSQNTICAFNRLQLWWTNTGDKESLLGNFQVFGLSEFRQWRAVFSRLTFAVRTHKVKNVQTVFAATLV